MHRYKALPVIFFVLLAASCGGGGDSDPAGRVFLTSAAGARFEAQPAVEFSDAPATGSVLTVWPDSTRQTMHGIGSSFTESSAFVLAHLAPEKRREVMERIYGAEGADFTLTRTHIGSCDFSVEGKYSYADVEDAALAEFSIAPDETGFDPVIYPGVKDAAYDLLPMILEAQAIKQEQGTDGLRIIGSAWTAPPWMKANEAWYIPGSEENNWQGYGGALKPEYEPVYADYLVKFLDAYAARGVDIWGLTPVNEPQGNGGNWESMDFSAESQRDFVKMHLGPKLQAAGHDDVSLLVYDQNRDHVEHWADVILGDPETAPYVTGLAVHWYASTVDVYEDAFDRVFAKFPDTEIIHTEGCIDNLGNAGYDGVLDPDGYQEENWFANDEFWWTRTATDWAYAAPWEWVDANDHPMYVPVHRYARNIIVSLDHGVSGWVDWNIVLDSDGGPNHEDNLCGAPIMIDTDTGEVYYTPVYWVLAQFSRTIRPGDKALKTDLVRAEGVGEDDLHACATVDGNGEVAIQVLNTADAPRELTLRIGPKQAVMTVPANAVQTVLVD